MALGNAMEDEAADEQNAADGAIDRALADAANRADPVPAAVVNAAKNAYGQRLPTSAVSTDDEVAEASSKSAASTDDEAAEASSPGPRTKTSATT